MKERFFAHFPLTDAEKKEVWEDAIFIFDTNIILELYRTSEATREELFSVLEHLGDRAWLTSQSAKEVFRGRASAISEELKSYERLKANFEKTVIKPLNSTRHPHLLPATFHELEAVYQKVQVETEEAAKRLRALILHDPILPRIAAIFGERVGEDLDEAALKEHIEIGKVRFEQQVPPGYEDAKKLKDALSDQDEADALGDYLIWVQAIKLCKQHEKSLVMVTNDQKDDWWHKENGDTLGPRTEMVEEFHSDTGRRMLMYRLKQFLPVYQEMEKVAVSEATIKEVSEKRVRLREEGEPHGARAPALSLRNLSRVRAGVEAERTDLSLLVSNVYGNPRLLQSLTRSPRATEVQDAHFVAKLVSKEDIEGWEIGALEEAARSILQDTMDRADGTRH